jgi:hypothetical protein
LFFRHKLLTPILFYPFAELWRTRILFGRQLQSFGKLFKFGRNWRVGAFALESLCPPRVASLFPHTQLEHKQEASPYGEFDLCLPCKSQTGLGALLLVSTVVPLPRRRAQVGTGKYLQRFTHHHSLFTRAVGPLAS